MNQGPGFGTQNVQVEDEPMDTSQPSGNENVQIEDETHEQVAVRTLERLFSGTCRVFDVGQLYIKEALSPNLLRKNLKRIINDLMEAVEETKYQYGGRMRVVKGIKVSPHESDSIYISIGRINRSMKRPHEKEVFQGLFTSCNAMVSNYYEPNDKILNLPLFICNTSKKYWSIMKRILEKLFQCQFISRTFNLSNMLCLAGKWIVTNNMDGDSIKINFSFDTGGQFSVDSDCEVSLDRWADTWQNLRELYNQPNATWKDRIRYCNVVWEILFEYFRDGIGIHMDKASFNKIMFRSFVISAEGRIKASNIDSFKLAKSVLSDLTYILDCYKSGSLDRRKRVGEML